MRDREKQASAETRMVVSRHDGVARSAVLEASIQEAVSHTLSTPTGAAMLDYLRSITMNRVLPPGAPDSELRELEGQRRLVAGLMSRMAEDERDRRRASDKETTE